MLKSPVFLMLWKRYVLLHRYELAGIQVINEVLVTGIAVSAA